jgi:hypothetical protein
MSDMHKSILTVGFWPRASGTVTLDKIITVASVGDYPVDLQNL